MYPKWPAGVNLIFSRLNTDLHSPSMRKEKRMSEEDFIKNLSGINNGKDLDLEMLSNIYNRIKKFEYKANDDHINQVIYWVISWLEISCT